MNDDNRYVANVWQNDGQRILDNDWFDNRWNRRNRVLFVSKSLQVFTNALTLSVGVVLFEYISASCRCLFQFRLGVRPVLHTFSDPNTSLPTRLA